MDQSVQSAKWGGRVDIYLEFYNQRKCISKAKVNTDILKHTKAKRIQQQQTHITNVQTIL